MVLNAIRNRAFWTLDGLKGGIIKRHLNDVRRGVEHPNSPESKKIKEHNIKALLQHASSTTPFYRDYENIDNLEGYPVIRKNVIQDNFEAFKSARFKDANNFKVSTSGSTGVPFFLFQNKGKRQRNHADVIYFFDQAGFNIGNRLYELKVWRAYNKKNSLKSKLQNVVQFDISRLSDDRILEFINLIKTDRQTEKTMLGFASSYQQIAQYLENNHLQLENLGIVSAIANSEYLNPYTKKTLGRYLNTKVLSRYSSVEIGIIAQQTLESPNNFVLNHASYQIELLNFENNEPVKPGEFGRIVVTDLFNYAMPIIRYDTGDVAKMEVHPNGTRYFKEIQGRKMDMIYDTSGNIVSSFVVYTKFYKYYRLIKQYQFIQQSKKTYEIKLNLQGDRFEFENELITDVKLDFGRDAVVSITYVDEIPALASGKRRQVINNYVKES
jgi:phenylacetate-CoA ligase